MADTTVEISGRQVDLARALPLTVGDWRALKKAGVTPAVMRRMEADPDFDVIAAWMLYVLHKADANIKEADVDAMTQREMVRISRLMTQMSKDEEDDPLSASASSTDSPASTAGASPTSSS